MTESTCQGDSQNCSSLMAHHITSKIQYICQFLRPESIIVIKNSVPHWTEQLTLMTKSCVTMRLLLNQESGRFSLGFNSSCAGACTAPTTCLPSPPGIPDPPSLLLKLSLKNSAMFPVPSVSSHLNIKSLFVKEHREPFPRSKSNVPLLGQVSVLTSEVKKKKTQRFTYPGIFKKVGVS